MKNLFLPVFTSANAGLVPASGGGTANVLYANGKFAAVTATINANNGIVSNSSGVFVNANNGIVSNSSGVFALGANGITVTAAGINILTGNGLVTNSSGLIVIGNTGVTVNSSGLFATQGTVTSISTGNGLGGGSISSSGILYANAGTGIVVNTSGINVLSNNGIVSNSSGVFVNANNFYINSSGYAVGNGVGLTSVGGIGYGSIALLDDITTNFGGSNTTFNLTVSSSAITPLNAQSLLVILGGVIQAPITAYTISGSQIIFASAPASTDTCFMILNCIIVANTGLVSNSSGVFVSNVPYTSVNDVSSLVHAAFGGL